MATVSVLALVGRFLGDANFDCRMANDPATIDKESTNENNTDVDRWADARRLRINGKSCS
jgi:hypothetical protein